MKEVIRRYDIINNKHKKLQLLVDDDRSNTYEYFKNAIKPLRTSNYKDKIDNYWIASFVNKETESTWGGTEYIYFNKFMEIENETIVKLSEQIPNKNKRESFIEFHKLINQYKDYPKKMFKNILQPAYGGRDKISIRFEYSGWTTISSTSINEINKWYYNFNELCKWMDDLYIEIEKVQEHNKKITNEIREMSNTYKMLKEM